MENLIPQDFNKLLNSSPEPSPDPPHQGVSQPPFFPKTFENSLIRTAWNEQEEEW